MKEESDWSNSITDERWRKKSNRTREEENQKQSVKNISLRYIYQLNENNMSIPQPPDGSYSHDLDQMMTLFVLDLETRNIIEKLASFVARMLRMIIAYFLFRRVY